MKIEFEKIRPLLTSTLNEDIGEGDITTQSCIESDKTASALIIAKQVGIVCGLDLIKYIFDLIDPKVSVKCNYSDGNRVRIGDIIAEISGNARSILSVERIILNFLQHLSGVATTTSKYVNTIKETKTKILDTRKTLPGLRYLQKYAVKTGGGENHRMGLYDMVLIKDNHIKVAGSITNAVSQAREKNPNIKIEVECSNLEEVKEAAKTDCNWIMLDNMPAADMKEALKLITKQSIEASGGITLKNIREVAGLGLDYISVGAITHSYDVLDMSMKINISK